MQMGIPAVRSGRPSLDGRPDTPFLVDRFGRTARDLRVSITEKCSLRCTYCMPEEGLPAIPREELLTVEEIESNARTSQEQAFKVLDPELKNSRTEHWDRSFRIFHLLL